MLPLVLIDRLPYAIAILGLSIPFASSFALTYIILAIDADSVISIRRIFALAFLGNVIWAIPFLIGSAVGQAHQSSMVNEFIFGAFLAFCLELIVINGAFIRSTAISIILAAVHPISILLVTIPFTPRVVTAYPGLLSGAIALTFSLYFLTKFKAFRTNGAVAINSLALFHAFLKTWIAQRPEELEKCLLLYSHEEHVITNLIWLHGKNQDLVLVLPGVHPGPFFPVGSYNISELIYQEIRKRGIIPITLHGMGGHERNLPTNELARQYAAKIGTSIQSTSKLPEDWTRSLRGPTRSKFGALNLTAFAFKKQAIGFLSSAPFISDDLDPGIVYDATVAAAKLGINLTLIDAHNSIGGQKSEPPRVTEDLWRDTLLALNKTEDANFEFGVAHSSELEFEHGSDISDGGIGVLLLRMKDTKYALVAADANNAALGLRQSISEELKRIGVNLLELCTSDTHNLSARDLTHRGYYALAEDSDSSSIVETVKKLTTLAEGRLAQGSANSTELSMELPLIGNESLNEFANLTKRASTFAKTFAEAMAVIIAVLFFVALFY